jgi:hypothetical protein
MGAIVTDAAVEQLNPLGTPHWMGMSEAGTSIQGMIDAGKEADEKAKSSRSYDTGGILEPGGVGFNMSNRPEAVLTESQWDAMAMGGGSGNGSGVNIENVTVSDVGEMSRALSKRERLNTMRYTGIPR